LIRINKKERNLMIESRDWKNTTFHVTNYTLLLLFAVLCFLPLMHIFAVSLSDRASADGGFVTLFPLNFTVANYREIFQAGTVYRAFWVSTQRTIFGTLINVVMTILAAYPLSKTAKEFKGRNIFMGFFLFAMLFSGGLIPWFLVINNLKMINTMWALILPGAVPIFNVILLMNFFRDVPKELDEASVIDGASHWQKLWNIYLPISIPAIATITLFAAVGHWNSWFDGMVLMTKNEMYPLQTFLRTVVVEQNIQSLGIDMLTLDQVSSRSVKAATIFVSTIPILLVYPLLQGYFVSGIKLGSVKG
jgi:putative aldouronate transport system permease protein